MKLTKALLVSLVLLAGLLSAGMLASRPRAVYMLYHHKDGRTTTFTSVGLYFRE